MLKKTAFITALLSACTVLAGSVHPGDTIELHGRLVLHGNEPFVYAVVYDDTGCVWTLKGISRNDAAKLQNQIVRVTAKVISEDPFGAAAQVHSIFVDEPK